MKKQTLWKRIFGQKSDKKAKAQQAFQEQFDTKLRFRELEPRVVLAADVEYVSGTGTLTINFDDDGGVVEIGRDVDGKLFLSGDLGTVTDWIDNDIYSISNLVVNDDATVVSTSGSTVTLLDSLDDTATSKTFVTVSTTLTNLDQFTVSDGADANLGVFSFTSDIADKDSNQLSLLGITRTDSTSFTVTNDSEHATTVTDAGATTTPQLISSGAFDASEDDSMGGQLSINLTEGEHSVGSLGTSTTSSIDLSFKSAGTLTVNDVNANDLHLETVSGDIISTGKIQQTNAMGSATFIAGDGNDVSITGIGSSFAGSINLTGDKVKLTVTASSIQLDQVDVDDDLDLVSASDIVQVSGGKIEVGDKTTLDLLGNGDINLTGDENNFGGLFDITAGSVTKLQNFHLSNDNTMPSLGSKLESSFAAGTMTDISLLFEDATSYDLPAINILGNLTVHVGGDLGQVAAKDIQVRGLTSIEVAEGANVDLSSATNKLATISVNAGSTDAAGTVTIVDSSNDGLDGAYDWDEGLTLSDIYATTLSVTTTGTEGDIDQASALFIDGMMMVEVAADVDVDLSSPTNELASVSVNATSMVTAGTVTIVDSNNDDADMTGNTKDDGLTLKDIYAKNLDVTTLGAEGDIDQSGSLFITITATFEVDSDVDVDLSSVTNQLATISVFGSSSSAAGIVTIVDALGELTLDSIKAATLNATALADGITQTATGIEVSGVGAFTAADSKNIDLDNSGSNKFGTVNATGATGAADVVTIDDSDGDLTLGEIDAGILLVEVATSISQTSDGVKVSGAAEFTSGIGQSIDLDNSSSNEFTTISAKATGGAAGAVTIEDSTGNLELDDIQASKLEVTTVGEITQTSVGIKVSGTSNLVVGDDENVSLTAGAANNAFVGAISVSGDSDAAGTVEVSQDTGDLVLGAIDAKNLTVIAETGQISQTSEGVQVAQSAHFDSGDGKDILLNSSSKNVFEGEVDLLSGSGTPNVVALNNSGVGLLLDQVEASGDLTIMTAGGISQTNAGATDYVQVGGTSSFTVSDDADILLGTNTNNKFNTVNATGKTDEAGTVSLYDSDGNLTLGDIVAKNLTAENGAGGDILDTTTTAIEISELTTLKANNILLNTSTAKHQIDDLTLDASGNANVVELDGFSFVGTNAIDGTLTVNAGGAIDQPSGELTVMGTTDITSTAGISLDQDDNDFQDTITLSGTAVKIVDADQIKLGNVTADSLDVYALTGKIFQDGGTALDIAGETLAKATDTYDVLLNQGGNDFTGAVHVLGFSMPANVVLVDMNDLVIGNVDSDTLMATAGQSITQAAGTSIDADTSVTLEAGTTITLRDLSTAMLDMDAGGAIDQEDTTAVVVTGMTTIEVPMGANVDLSNEDNEFGSIQINKTLGDYAGTVKVYDSTGDLELKDIWADVLEVTVEDGAISQAAGTSVRSSTSVSLDVSGAIVLSDITTGMLALTAGGSISQVGGTSLLVSGMTTIEVDAGEDVDLSEMGNELGSISVNASNALVTPGMEVYAGTVTIYDGGNDDADMTDDTADDGLTLKDIWADMLVITTAGAEGHIDQQFDMMPDMLGDDSGIHITGMTMIKVEAGVNVDLSSELNELGSIAVNASNALVAPGTEVFAGTVTIYDGGNDDADMADDTADDGLTLKDIWTDMLVITTAGAEGHIDQQFDMLPDPLGDDSGIRVTGMTKIEVEEGVNVDLSSELNKLGSISVNGDSMLFAGTVTVYDGGNDNGDATDKTWDDGLTLKDIWTDMLVITTEGTAGHIDQQFDMLPDPAGDDSGIRIAGMTTIEVEADVTVDLSSELNKLGSISVNSDSGAFAALVTIYDGGNDDADAMDDTWDDGLTLKDIYTDLMVITTAGAEGHIDQQFDMMPDALASDTGIRVTGGLLKIEVDAGVDVDLSSELNELTSISVNSDTSFFAGTVEIYDGANDNVDAAPSTADDGLTLNNIWADILTVTTAGAEGHIDQQFDGAPEVADPDTGIRVTGMTKIAVDTGVNVDLSSKLNKLGSISVNADTEDFAGTVTIYDSSNDNADAMDDTWDDGLTLKDIWTDMLVITTEGAEGHIDQQFDMMPDMLGDDTGIRVTGMTMIEVEAGVDVDLSSELNKLGSIAVNGDSELYAGNVTIFDGENDNADAMDKTWDDGLTLKDIWADMLMVTTVGAEGHIDQQFDMEPDPAGDDTGIRVTGMVKIEVDEAVNVDLSSTLNKLNSIAVNESNNMVTPGMEVFAGTVTIFDNFNDDADATEDTWDDGVYLKDIWANILTVRSDANISQIDDTLLTIITQTNLSLAGEGSITLLNDGDSEDCEDLDPATGNDLSADVNVELDNLAFLKNFEILNINDGADIPGLDFSAAVNNGTVIDLTLKYTQAPLVTLPAINILGDLWIESGDDIQQSATLKVADISVGGDATFIGDQIHLAANFDMDVNEQDLKVAGNATFFARSGEIEVGVTSQAIDAMERGLDSGAKVELGTTTFHADSSAGHVTITQDNQMTLVNTDILFCDDKMEIIGNLAQSAVLTSMTAGIGTSGVVDVTVQDLATLKANTEIILGDSGDSNVDLRILYINEADGTKVANVSIYEQNDSNGLAIVDGTTISETGTLAIQTEGHIVQVNEFRDSMVAPAHDDVVAGKGLFVSEEGGVLLTSVDFDSLAVSAEGTPLFVTQEMDLNFAKAGISDDDGFGGNLTTDAIDSDLPTDNGDTFAKAAVAESFEDGVGEDYSIIVVDINDLTIEDVADSMDGDVEAVEGIRTRGAEAGHVYLRTSGGNLTFDAGGGSDIVVGLANSGVITALASGDLEIASGNLQVTSGTNMGELPFALVSTIAKFTETILPAPDDQFEVDDNGKMDMGPVYAREPGEVSTYFFLPSVSEDPTAEIVIQELGDAGELDFRLLVDWADDTVPLPEEFEFAASFGPDAILSHTYSTAWLSLNQVTSLEVTAMAYNSPQINLYDNVVSETQFENLSLVTDRFNFFFSPVEPYVPEINDFVRPDNPVYAMPVIYDPAPTPYPSLTEIADDTRVATQIDSVTVVEVDPDNRDMEIGEEIELDDDFMTLDAVKDYIQNGDQFPPGLYKIEILYPGTEVPEEHFYWKQDRPDPFDLFSHNIRPVAPQTAELAAADQAKAQLSAEEVWAREYDKWFPAATDGQSTNDLSVPAAESESNDMIPSEDDILIERVTTVSSQEIDRMTDRLRAKRSIVRDSLNGAMIGGAALMAAVAAQGRKDDEAPNDQAEDQRDPPEESLDGTSLNRLRRRVRQWL